MTKEKPKESKHDHKDCDGDNPTHDALAPSKAVKLRAVFAINGTWPGNSRRIEMMEPLTTLSTTVDLSAEKALKPVTPIGTVGAPIVRFSTMRTNHV